MLVKSGDFVPPETARPGLNPELYRVIRKAMAKTAGDRYQKAEEMLVDVEQVMRLAFRPVGQTELQRWLADLSSKDGVPPLTREGAARARADHRRSPARGRRAGIGPGVEPRRRRGDSLEGSAAAPARRGHRGDDARAPVRRRRTAAGSTGARSGSCGGGILIVGLLVLSVRAMRGGGKPEPAPGTPAGRGDAGGAPESAATAAARACPGAARRRARGARADAARRAEPTPRAPRRRRPPRPRRPRPKPPRRRR